MNLYVMTQEEKSILLKDLCARLPYGVKVELHKNVYTLLGYFDEFVILTANVPTDQQTNISNIKPYLRPLSSMTNEERTEFLQLIGHGTDIQRIDFYLSHYFDFRCLIQMGLAIEAPNDMYK